MATPPDPELLAPAGDWESLRAAVANGADAVYFGLTHFNARARATNFTPEELPAVMQFLHHRNVRGFVTLNTLIFSDELPAVAELVTTCAEAGVDAVIVQDLGLVRLIRQIAPTLPIHASTQMTLSEPRGIAFVRNLGVERVVLARELSLEEIRRVTAATDTPVEVFVHGALCVAYSGQCLTSEAIGGRSANRGQCAQACRLPYELIVDGTARDLGDRAYLLSPQDLAAYNHIQPLIDAGVISFKIEGRLKGGPYVAATTQTYRKAIDAALAHRDFHLTRREELDLAQTFSRGLTPGFLDGVNHQQLVRGRFPKSRGIRVGRVVSVTRRGVRVELCEPFDDLLKPGDGVLFDIGKPEEKEPGGRVWSVSRASGPASGRCEPAGAPASGRASDRCEPAGAASGQASGRCEPAGADQPADADRSPADRSPHVVELQFQSGTVDLAAIPIGCDVYRTDDPALRKRLEQSYAQDQLVHRQRLSARVSGTVGGPVTLAFTDPDGHTATATWPGPLELATKRPTPADEIRLQLARLGDTPFELGELTIELPAGVLVPRSVLNALRRQAATTLASGRRQPAGPASGRRQPAGPHRPVHTDRSPTHRPVHTDRSPTHRPVHTDRSPTHRPVHTDRSPRAPQLTVLVRTLEQLDAVLAWVPPDGLPRPAAVYCDFEDLRRYQDAVPRARAAGLPIGLATLRILKPGEEGFQSLLTRAKPDLVLVRNLASIEFFQNALPTAQLVGDFSLNVANELTADLLIGSGLVRLVPSFDLNWDQLAAMVRRSHPDWFEPVVHQHMPMFHMEHCVFAAFLSTGKDHRDCGRPCDRHRVELRDRVGANFPVLPDTGCRNTVFNSVAQSAAEYIERMRDLGLTRFRVDLLRETPEHIGPLLDRYARVIAGQADGRQTWRQLQVLNQLGVTRGTLQLL
jgi:putative protease